MMNLSEKIIKLRKQQGWSQEELAERMNISRQSVSKWESGASVPDLDKILAMSSLFGVTTDYLLKEDEYESVSTPKEPPIRVIAQHEANEFISRTRFHAVKIALGVSLAICSPILLIILAGISEAYGILVESAAVGIGVAVLLGMVAVSVGLFIFSGMQLGKYEFLEKEIIALQNGVRGILEQEKAEYDPTHRKSIMIGVVLIIAGVIPMVLVPALGADGFAVMCCVGILLLCVAVGVNLLVRAGCVFGAYQKLLQQGDYSVENKQKNKKTAAFAGCYWCIVIALYLLISFLTMKWNKTWVIWPVAGVLYAAVEGIMLSIMKKKQG
ncbi:MAG: helix-turn-helix domain-containing protein [Christensenellaceae bacterium]|nr:helix-turn-helix domain-containing protein [Christensenellaceae bacterium]